MSRVHEAPRWREQKMSMRDPHNSVNSASDLAEYFALVRDGASFRRSVDVFIDDQGIEVSVK